MADIVSIYKPKIVVLTESVCFVPDADAEEKYFAAYINAFAGLIEQSPEQVAGFFFRTRNEVDMKPHQFGLEIDGKIVAPATDIFNKARVCAQSFLQQKEENSAEWTGQLDALHKIGFAQYITTLRHDFLVTVQVLRERGIAVYIVADTDPEYVRSRLMECGEEHEWVRQSVLGPVERNRIADEQTENASVHHMMLEGMIPGLMRPLYAYRSVYHTVLKDILALHQDQQATMRDMVVVGEVLETDLLLRAVLGASGVLLCTPRTPVYEHRWVMSGIVTGLKLRGIRFLSEVLNP